MLLESSDQQGLIDEFFEELRAALDWSVSSVGDDVSKMIKMLDEGLDINAKSSEGRSVLEQLMYYGNLKNVKMGEKLLPYTDFVEMIIKRGADVNMTSATGVNPLIVAVKCGYIDLVKILIDNGANVNVHEHFYFKGTPLHMAARIGRADIVKMLLNSGAEVDALDDWNRTPLAGLAEQYLLFGSSKKPLDILKMLIDAGADIEAVGSQGKSPLKMLVEDFEREAAKFLIQNGADIFTAFDDAKEFLKFFKDDTEWIDPTKYKEKDRKLAAELFGAKITGF